MVNVQKYQVVAIGNTVSECEENYNDLMYESGIKKQAEDTREVKTLASKITKIAQGVVDGDSHFYIMLEGSDDIFDVSVVDFIDIIKYNVGDTVTVEYKEGERANSVLSLNGEEPDQKAKETKNQKRKAKSRHYQKNNKTDIP